MEKLIALNGKFHRSTCKHLENQDLLCDCPPNLKPEEKPIMIKVDKNFLMNVLQQLNGLKIRMAVLEGKEPTDAPAPTKTQPSEKAIEFLAPENIMPTMMEMPGGMGIMINTPPIQDAIFEVDCYQNNANPLGGNMKDMANRQQFMKELENLMKKNRVSRINAVFLKRLP